MKRLTVYMVLAVVLLSLLPAAGTAAEKFSVYTVNYPLYYFAKRIAAEYAEVVFPAPADNDPALWTPSLAIIRDYQKADMILLNGADYARWVTRASLPRSRLVDTSKGFNDRYISNDEQVTHSHGPGGEHSHTGTAFTTWLDFSQAAVQAEAVAAALAREKPEHKDKFKHNLEALQRDLIALDKKLAGLVAAQPDLPMLASHPVYQYLARRYQLNLMSLHWEPTVLPEDAQWTQLAAVLVEHAARWMIWEAAPLPEITHRLARRGIHSLVFNPCANVPQQGDWLSVMRQNIDNLKPAFAGR